MVTDTTIHDKRQHSLHLVGRILVLAGLFHDLTEPDQLIFDLLFHDLHFVLQCVHADHELIALLFNLKLENLVYILCLNYQIFKKKKGSIFVSNSI